MRKQLLALTNWLSFFYEKIKKELLTYVLDWHCKYKRIGTGSYFCNFYSPSCQKMAMKWKKERNDVSMKQQKVESKEEKAKKKKLLLIDTAQHITTQHYIHMSIWVAVFFALFSFFWSIWSRKVGIWSVNTVLTHVLTFWSTLPQSSYGIHLLA